MGAYLQLLTPVIASAARRCSPASTLSTRSPARSKASFTNKTPTDAYRGAGRPEAAYAIERIVDSLARRLDMDPIEVRRKNFYEPFDEPTATPAGLEYDSMNMQAAVDRALELSDYEGLREEQKRRRENNDPVQLGIGFSTYTEICGLGPSQALAGLGIGGAGWEAANVRMLLTGKVEVATGTSPHGQGHETSWSQIAADALGVARRRRGAPRRHGRLSHGTGYLRLGASRSVASRYIWRARRSWTRPRRSPRTCSKPPRTT